MQLGSIIKKCLRHLTTEKQSLTMLIDFLMFLGKTMKVSRF
jgi:hypothetical protein